MLQVLHREEEERAAATFTAPDAADLLSIQILNELTKVGNGTYTISVRWQSGND